MNIEKFFLNKSNSYTYYKNKTDELIKIKNNQEHVIKKLKSQNNKLKKEIIELKDSKKKNDAILNSISNLNIFMRDSHVEILSSINAVYNLNKNLNNINKLISKEINYGIIFHDTINESKWLEKKEFSLNNGAANYSFMYVLYRILNEINPNNILELGLGQTSKMTTQYANFFTDTQLLIIDNDEDWINNFSKNLNISNNVKIIHNETETFIHNGTENLRYANLDKNIGEDKFDLIIIDSPQGFISEPSFHELDYSRSNIWNLIDNLSKDFVIIIDDFERQGEKNTINELQKLLNEKNIVFYTFNSIGLKEQFVICSEKYKFISWF